MGLLDRAKQKLARTRRWIDVLVEAIRDESPPPAVDEVKPELRDFALRLAKLVDAKGLDLAELREMVDKK
jgi:hypothetical protein